mgnify:CR=1 FL=1
MSILECNIFSNFPAWSMYSVLLKNIYTFLYCFSPYFVHLIRSVFLQESRDGIWNELIFLPKMITVIGWIITGISWGIVLVTMPFSLCVCFKVSHSPNIKFSPIFGNLATLDYPRCVSYLESNAKSEIGWLLCPVPKRWRWVVGRIKSSLYVYLCSDCFLML